MPHVCATCSLASHAAVEGSEVLLRLVCADVRADILADSDGSAPLIVCHQPRRGYKRPWCTGGSGGKRAPSIGVPTPARTDQRLRDYDGG